MITPDGVAALSSDVAYEAQLYSEISGRPFVACGRSRDNAAVFVGTPADITVDLLDELYLDRRRGETPGLLIGEPGHRLRQQVRTRAAAVSSRESYTRAFARIPETGTVISGENAAADALVDAEVLSLTGHSDGIDASAGQFILCPFLESTLLEGTDRARRPSCEVTAHCHRLDMPRQNALADARLIAPTSVRARVLLWQTCWGIFTNPSAIDAKWSLGLLVASSPNLGAIVTTWRVHYWAAGETDPLAKELLSGTSIGVALSAFLRKPQSRRRGVSLCLLGDPAVRLDPRRSANFAVTPTPRPTLLRYDRSNIEFLRVWLIEQEHRHGRRDSVHALATLETFERCLWRNLPTEPEPGNSLRAAFLALLANAGGSAFSDALTLPSDKRVANGCKCPSCCGTSIVFTSLLRVNVDIERRIIICPRCGIVADSSNTLNLALSLSSGSDTQLSALALKGDRPTGDWLARLAICPRDRSKWQFFDWPEDDDRRAAPVYRIPRALPDEPHYIALYFMWQDHIAVLRVVP